MYGRLENIFLKEGLITERVLQDVLSLQKRQGRRFIEIVINFGYAREEEVAQILGRYFSLPFISAASGRLNPVGDENLEELIPHEFAAKNLVLPLCRTANAVLAAVSDPDDFDMISNLEKLTGCSVKFAVATRSDLKKAIHRFYGKQ